MLFVLIGKDGPDGLERRKETRLAHLEHWSSLAEAGRLAFAGPLLEGDQPIGSLVIFHADSPAEARRIADADPYVTARVFASTELRPSKQVLPAS